MIMIKIIKEIIENDCYNYLILLQKNTELLFLQLKYVNFEEILMNKIFHFFY